jgi:IS5 family transposase
MIGHSPEQNQKNLFQPLLKEFIDLQHELVLLSDKIDWKTFEKEFVGLYSNTGSPAKPIRLMAGLLILKQLYDLGDETIIPAWISNPYMQYFCGEAHFQWQQPCDPSDLVHFRKRIGPKGIERIFAVSISIHGSSAQSDEICVDTTAQEKNITYPTDVKLQIKIIKGCQKIAMKENLTQRQSYQRTVKKLLLLNRFSHHPTKRKQGLKAQRKIKTIAGRVVRELQRKLPQEKMQAYEQQLGIYKQVLNQKRHDTNKVYSLHEPEVACIAKGKIHKPYEFGSKVALAITKHSNIIVAAVNFTGNPHDIKTLEATLNQHELLTGHRAKAAIVDRGFRGRKMFNGTQIISPDNSIGKTGKQKRNSRIRFKRRAAIEPVISHMKHNFGMIKNYLKGSIGDQINPMMAAAAFNFKSWLNKYRKTFLTFIDNQYNYTLMITIAKYWGS